MAVYSLRQGHGPRVVIMVVTACWLWLSPTNASAQTVSRSAACSTLHTFNETYPYEYTSQIGGHIGNINFHFGTGQLLLTDYGYPQGDYAFGDLVDASATYALGSADIYVNNCLQVGSYGPPRIPGDTDWVDVYIEGDHGGIVTPLYNGEAATCDGITQIEYDPNDPPPDCVGGGGPNEQVEVCIIIVLTDGHGTPILDDYGNYIVLEDLGCFVQ